MAYEPKLGTKIVPGSIEAARADAVAYALAAKEREASDES